jgi:ATP-dependent Clp protease ATP-binding subunit ClpB
MKRFTGGDVQPSQDLVRILNLCDKLAQKKKDNFISSEPAGAFHLR